MLIRLLVKNLFSFRELTEFNMVPGRFNRLSHHVYSRAGGEALKINALYGANGTGKSNLIKVLALLTRFVTKGEMPREFITQTFKLDEGAKVRDVYIGLEFVKENVPYYYGLTINQGVVVEEELQISGLGKQADKVLFLRTDSALEPKIDLSFAPEVMQDTEANLLVSILKNEILERNTLILNAMRKRRNAAFLPLKNALDWFEQDLIIVFPSYKPGAVVVRLEQDQAFSQFVRRIIHTFDTGVLSVDVDTIPLDDYFGVDDRDKAEQVLADLRANPTLVRGIRTHEEDVVFVLKENKGFAKKIVLRHEEDRGLAKFYLSEESDGTRRLLDYLVLFYSILQEPKTYLVDEIERSIHPLLIKELIQKFSSEQATAGQLIFSTHESNLLDQTILRPDEIWFTEKNSHGATELYPLSEFKEHHTIDIRKGYLNGRYGGIPFLGNLKDLKWGYHAEANPV